MVLNAFPGRLCHRVFSLRLFHALLPVPLLRESNASQYCQTYRRLDKLKLERCVFSTDAKETDLGFSFHQRLRLVSGAALGAALERKGPWSPVALQREVQSYNPATLMASLEPDSLSANPLTSAKP